MKEYEAVGVNDRNLITVSRSKLGSTIRGGLDTQGGSRAGMCRGRSRKSLAGNSPSWDVPRVGMPWRGG